MARLDAVYFYCDQCDLLDAVIPKFTTLFPHKKVQTFSHTNLLVKGIKENHPDYILVYLTKPDRDVMSAVKYFRENDQTKSIPILIYQQLPTEEDLKQLYQNLI